jgi:hypothetical protein
MGGARWALAASTRLLMTSQGPPAGSSSAPPASCSMHAPVWGGAQAAAKAAHQSPSDDHLRS